jgi:WD40 repeat protein
MVTWRHVNVTQKLYHELEGFRFVNGPAWAPWSFFWLILSWILYLQAVRRTSSLDAPIMLLTGHGSAVYTMKFNPQGTAIASGSHDKDIFLWNVQGDCENYMVLKGHRNAVVDLSWSGDGTHIVSASPDKTVRAWDAITGKQVPISPSQVFWWFDAV